MAEVLTTIQWLLNIGLAVWIAVLLFRKREESKADTAILDFDALAPGKDGRFINVLKDSETGAGGRRKLVGAPLDVDFAKLRKFKRKLRESEIIGAGHRIMEFGKGELSRDWNIKMIIPPYPDHLSPTVKNSFIGVGIRAGHLAQDFIRKHEELFEKAIRDRDALSKEIFGGELGEMWMQSIKGAMLEFLDMQAKGHEAKRKVDSATSFPAGTHQHG